AFLLALNAIDSHADPMRTIELLRIAAEMGYEGAYTLLAVTLERDAPQLAEEARRWRLESARAGNAESARKVADWYAEGTPPRDARRAQLWYVEAVRHHEDMVAALSLAKLLLREPKDVVGGLPEAAQLLQGLTEMGNAEARRLYADVLVLGRGVDRDAVAAEKVMREAVADGDLEAQSVLGIWLVEGSLGPDRVSEGYAELSQAAARGHGHALNALAQFRYWGVGTNADRDAARASWEQALETGYLPAFNDFAWHLCTVSDSAFFDAKRGLEVMATMSERTELRYDAIDTEAACHAAAGDFDAAVATQQRAIELARTVGVPGAEIVGMEGRLSGYRSHQRATTNRPPYADATPGT
ncbi:MAG TPA: hypothetical protein VFL14_02580, partial [Xanthomonadales bacterium]|nr:hypothetical protein [Xanthomonadales bacterium]